mmetsp:Transcript_2367/g.3842  ORF Transcript_2367/g.3842 Transcript_2367/m.3842 type:complete len:257 (-) Transcript_2367:376-1146(-)
MISVSVRILFVSVSISISSSITLSISIPASVRSAISVTSPSASIPASISFCLTFSISLSPISVTLSSRPPLLSVPFLFSLCFLIISQTRLQLIVIHIVRVFISHFESNFIAPTTRHILIFISQTRTAGSRIHKPLLFKPSLLVFILLLPLLHRGKSLQLVLQFVPLHLLLLPLVAIVHHHAMTSFLLITIVRFFFLKLKSTAFAPGRRSAILILFILLGAIKPFMRLHLLRLLIQQIAAIQAIHIVVQLARSIHSL